MVKNVAKGEVALGGTSWCFCEFPDTPVVEVTFDDGGIVGGERNTEIGIIGMGTFQEDIECFTGGVMGDWANEVLGDVLIFVVRLNNGRNLPVYLSTSECLLSVMEDIREYRTALKEYLYSASIS